MKSFCTPLCSEVFKLQLISKTKCTSQLQRWLAVSICNMKINILNSVYLSLVHAPEILLVSPSGFNEQQKMGIPQIAPSAGHQGLITSHSTSKKTQHISAGIFAQILTGLGAFKNSAQLLLQGRRLKTGQHRCHSQERVPKQKLLLPSLWNSQSALLFCFLLFSHFLCFPYDTC